MNRTSAITHGVALIALLSASLCFSMPPGNPSENASKASSSRHQAFSQRDLNDKTAAGARAADGEMNRVYASILSKYAKDETFIKKFKAAQRAWLVFRDAEVAANYPDMAASVSNDVRGHGHSRAHQTTHPGKSWLKGPLEGDVCANSLP